MHRSKPNAILIHGGWEGHEPAAFARRFGDALEGLGYELARADSLDVLDDVERLARADLIVPFWTMGGLSGEREKNLSQAVRAGTGLGGIHGGMGDAFRGSIEYEWMVGGHFVGHPHVGTYSVRVTRPEHPVVEGLPGIFDYDSEQYYMLIDPAVDVLAATTYRHDGREIDMPVIWTRGWGLGRVFYSALGHVMAEFDQYPDVFEATLRGLRWATRRS
ncbi:MAG: ThuA domain-containing protein [Puniceicoccaceae bacterium]